MKKLEFPLLQPEHIECRVGTVKQGAGFSLLLYKTARVDADILDSLVGQFNWQKKYYELKDNIYCSVGIFDEDSNTWVWKDDCGKESQTEGEKGEASDSFKRSCFAWGLGRELYSAPFIWVKETSEITPKGRYQVSKIDYDNNRKIKSLVITTEKGEVVYSYGSKEKVVQKAQNNVNTPITSTQDDDIDTLLRKIDAYRSNLSDDRRNTFDNWLLTSYNAQVLTDLTLENAKMVAVCLHIK